MNNEILIVEDDKSINDILFYALKSEGYTPYSTFTLKESREYININLPKLVLLDLNLP